MCGRKRVLQMSVFRGEVCGCTWGNSPPPKLEEYHTLVKFCLTGAISWVCRLEQCELVLPRAREGCTSFWIHPIIVTKQRLLPQEWSKGQSHVVVFVVLKQMTFHQRSEKVWVQMMNKFKHQCLLWRPLGRVLSKHLGSRQHYSRIWMLVCLHRAELKRCRSFVIYLHLLQQILRAIFLPHPANPPTLIFSHIFHLLPLLGHGHLLPSSDTTLPTSDLQTLWLGHFPASPPPFSLHQAGGPRDWNYCFISYFLFLDT